MQVLGLSARIRKRKKYKSYKGEVGKKAPNLINKQFEGSKPFEKCYTDVTEFALPNCSEKLYLSPVLDGYNSEIIGFTLSHSPNLMQVKSMLEKAFPKEAYPNTIPIATKVGNTNMRSTIVFLTVKGSVPPCLAKELARITV